MFKSKHTNTGFTLIELLIVVAIVGILAAIAIPAITGHRYNQSRIYCDSGWQFLNGRQVVNEQGGGIRCENTN